MSLAFGLAAAGAAELVVAPHGDDANPGTEQRPLATLDGARSAVRRLLAAGVGEDIAVRFHGGTYPVAAPVVFGPEDSARGRQVITYAASPGETPVFSGGRKIRGWQRKGAVWTAELPEARDGKWVFRRLYVQEERRTLARMPDEGDYFRMLAPGADDPKGTLGFSKGNLRNWPGVAGANMVALLNWESCSIPLAKVDEYCTMGVARDERSIALRL